MNQGDSSRGRSRFDAWPRWKRLLLLSAPVLLLLLAGELGGRLLERYAGYMPRRYVSYAHGNPYLRSALVPGLRFRSGPFQVDVDSFGFRGGEITIPKPRGTFRIFAVGESSTFGWKGTYSHEGAWPALLESKLRAAHPDRQIEVINAGVPGYTSIEQRVNFMLRISHLQPDAILIYHGNNDLNWSWVPDIETKLVYGRDLVEDPSWIQMLIDHSYVAMELRSRISLLGKSSRPKHENVDSTAIRVLKDNLQGLVDDARRLNLKVAIGTFANGFDEAGQPGQFNDEEKKLGVPAVGRWFDNLGPQGARRSFPVYNAMIRSLASANSLPLAEPASRVPKTAEYLTDWCHFTAKGEQLMADIWFETLQHAGWFST